MASAARADEPHERAAQLEREAQALAKEIDGYQQELEELGIQLKDRRVGLVDFPSEMGGRSVLLLFPRGGALQTVHMPGGTIPPHDGAGPLHVAFAIAKDELPEWEARLAASNIAIEGRTTWKRGGESIYFRDPDGHLLELATPGLWAIY